MSKKVINEMMKDLQDSNLVPKQDDTVTEIKIQEMIDSGSYYKTPLGFIRFTQKGWTDIDQSMKHGVTYELYQKYVLWEEEFAKVKINVR